MCMMVIDELHRIHWPFYKVSQWNYTLVIVQPMRFNMTAAAVIFIEVHLKSVILETTPFFVIRNQMSLFYIEVNEFKKGANTWFSLVTRIFFFFWNTMEVSRQTWRWMRPIISVQRRIYFFPPPPRVAAAPAPSSQSCTNRTIGAARTRGRATRRCNTSVQMVDYGHTEPHEGSFDFFSKLVELW